MNDQLIPPTHEEMSMLACAVEQAIGRCGNALDETGGSYSRGTLILRHDVADDMLPCVFDQLEFRGCRVENVFTLVLPGGQVYREVLFKVEALRPLFVSG